MRNDFQQRIIGQLVWIWEIYILKTIECILRIFIGWFFKFYYSINVFIELSNNKKKKKKKKKYIQKLPFFEQLRQLCRRCIRDDYFYIISVNKKWILVDFINRTCITNINRRIYNKSFEIINVTHNLLSSLCT